VARQYVPDAGDIVWLNFTPHAGREQARHRPALVLSPAAYNNKTSLMLCCPMTTQICPASPGPRPRPASAQADSCYRPKKEIAV
jgi:mRNA-degrading endonuclease toxin of MazEF toxin-antitoxin module